MKERISAAHGESRAAFEGPRIPPGIVALRSTMTRQRGMSLLELIIVMAIIGILAAVAVPLLKNAPRRAQEAALKQNLRVMRDAIEQHHADKGHYPPSLQALVEEEYLRAIPPDPITRSPETWVEVFAEYPSAADEDPWAETDLSPFGDPGIEDVHSGSEENSLNGEAYADW